MATTGTISTTVFTTRKVLDHAFRRCRLGPQQITAEYIQTAIDLLYLKLSTLPNRGLALWTITKSILPLYRGKPTVFLPVGTVDLLNYNLRDVSRILGSYSASEGVADNAFDGDIETRCTQIAAGGNIVLQLASGASVSTVGILPGASGTWNVAIQYSSDTLSWTSFYSNAALAVVDREWQWLDFEALPPVRYWRLLATAPTVLDVRELVFANNPREIPLYKLNRDDYFNLPNKMLEGRPVQFWFDKKRSQPTMTVWPTPDSASTFRQLTTLTQRYLMDIGTMQQEIEVPQSWYFACVNVLAAELALEIPEVRPELIPVLQAVAKSALDDAWSGQTDRSQTRIVPDISPYTR